MADLDVGFDDLAVLASEGWRFKLSATGRLFEVRAECYPVIHVARARTMTGAVHEVLCLVNGVSP